MRKPPLPTLSPEKNFMCNRIFSWDQVRDVQVFRHNWPRRFGRVVLSVAPQRTEAPDEAAELNLMYFENNETAESFAEESSCIVSLKVAEYSPLLQGLRQVGIPSDYFYTEMPV